MFNPLANFRLRTKLLLSLAIIIAALSCLTLLVVHQTADNQVRLEMQKDAHASVLTFQNLRNQRQIELNRQADLLATLPSIKSMMTADDPSADQGASSNLWEAGGSQLFALANWQGKIVALHTSIPGFPESVAAEMFARSSGRSEAGDWWYGNGRLYQVATQPIHMGSPGERSYLGTVIVGREMDANVVQDVARIASSEVVFRYGREVAISSLSAVYEKNVADLLRNPVPPDELHLGYKRYTVSTVDLTPGSTPAVTFTVLKSDEDAVAFLNRLNHILIALGFLGICAGAGLVYFISDTFTRPLASLVAGVRALETGDFHYPLKEEGGDEVAEVTSAFARMRVTLQKNEEQSKRLEDQLRQSQKMEAVGRLAGGVAHDFNNLLTVIRGHSDLLGERAAEQPSFQNGISQIRKAADRASSLTRQLLAFSRMQVLQPRIVDLNALITDWSKMLPMLIGEDVEFDFRPGGPLGKIKADPSQLEQIVLNLAVNARDAMPQGGRLTIQTRNTQLSQEYARLHPPSKPGRYVLLTVTDTGSGMNEETKARIFEPFFTTKEMGKGTGLGLATVYGIVKQSGGYIWVESAPAHGTTFEIYLPRISDVTEGEAPEKSAAPANHSSGTVLLVEDEEAVRDLACEFLKMAGYTVLVASDGQNALEMARLHKGTVDVLVTDVVMPRMRGTELAMHLKRSRKEIKIMYMSGYLDHHDDIHGYAPGSLFLQKPFSRDTLVQKVGEAFASRRTPLLV